MDKLKEYLKHSTCPSGIKECFYGDDCTCAECIDRILAEHDEKVREKVIKECMYEIFINFPECGYVADWIEFSVHTNIGKEQKNG